MSKSIHEKAHEDRAKVPGAFEKGEAEERAAELRVQFDASINASDGEPTTIRGAVRKDN